MINKRNCIRDLLLTISMVIAFKAIAIDYYWDTSHPPGDVQWVQGTSITDLDTLSINNLLNTSQNISNDGIINLYSDITVNNDIVNTSDGKGSFTVKENAHLKFSGTTLITQENIINDFGGAMDFPLSSVTTIGGNNIPIYNYGTINVDGIINSAGGSYILNQLGGTISFGAGSEIPGIANLGDISFNNNFTFNTLENYGTLLLSASVAGTMINIGNTIVSGNPGLAIGRLINIGALNFTITNTSIYDNLVVDNDIYLSGSTVNIDSTYSGPSGSSASWDILTSSGAIATNGQTIINIPSSTAFEQWSSEVVANTILRLYYINNGPSVIPLPGVDAEIANVLAAMQSNVTNSGQTELLAAVNSVTTQDLYNYLLNNLQPDTNNSSSSTTLAMQNIGFNKIESRVAGTGRNISGNHKAKRSSRANKSKANRTKTKSGFASGDLTPNTAMWMAGFGSLSKQHAKGDNQGYRAKILGGMLGIDSRTKNDDVYGIAFGVSNANVYGLENTTFTTRILGYNLMLYGANNFKRNFFAEWIVSGVINKNHGVRVFGVNGIDLSTESSYRGALGGVRVNVGKNFKLNNTFNLSQVNTVQYVLVHQSDYDEGGSVAALHVATKENQSILTLGTGLRLGIFNNDSWMTGNRELRAMVTYDVISPNQATTANFVVGSDSFIMNSSAVRLALKLGADYGVMLSRKLSLQFSYDYEMRAGYYDNFGEVKLRYLF